MGRRHIRLQPLKTDSRKSGSTVTGHFASSLVPSYLQRRVEYEEGNYTQYVDWVHVQRTGWQKMESDGKYP